MKNDEGEFCNFELYGFLANRINHSLWDSFTYKPMIYESQFIFIKKTVM